MKHIRPRARFLTPLLAVAAMAIASLAFGLQPASASDCTFATSCPSTGTVTLSAGSLQLSTPSTLTWSTQIGTSAYDTVTNDQSYYVTDASGSGAGWKVTVKATQFSGTYNSNTVNLPTSGVLSTNGSSSLVGASTSPTSACVTSGQCTVPTNTASYPASVTMDGSTPTTIFDTAAATGVGAIQISNAYWWVTIPANAYAIAYSTTITFTAASGP